MNDVQQHINTTYQLDSRLRWIMAGFILVTILIVSKMIVTATAYTKQRQQLRVHGKAKDVILIPGLRGTLIDQPHGVMVQSRRRILLKPINPHDSITGEDMNMTNKIHWQDITESLDRTPQIYFKRWSRKLDHTPLTQKELTYLGETYVDSETGLERGKNGLELELDATLKASLITCKILGDNRRVILSTFTPNGQDATLPEPPMKSTH